MYVARVRIELKKGVSDPEGSNTLKALHLLGLKDVQAVSTERIIRLKVEAKDAAAAKASAERACRRLLTNPVIHDFSIEVESA
jgi:phosphoribosylformylglycinamidine synthase subunit PurS